MKWEYMTMDVSGKPSGRKMKKLNQLGQDGWELISQSYGGVTTNIIFDHKFIKGFFLLKRPL